MTPDEIKRQVEADGIPRCLQCGRKMRFNVPRLGPDGGYVHVDTGRPLCGIDPLPPLESVVTYAN